MNQHPKATDILNHPILGNLVPGLSVSYVEMQSPLRVTEEAKAPIPWWRMIFNWAKKILGELYGWRKRQ